MKGMNKSQLIDAIAHGAQISKSAAKHSVEAALEAMKDSLCKGDKVIISGFGSFYVANQQGRVGRDPRNGQPIRINPKRIVKFRAGADLAEKIK